MIITLDWLGVGTFRLIVDEQVIFLDAYMDRAPAAPSVGLRAGEVDRADHVLIGHSHFDHLWGWVPGTGRSRILRYGCPAPAARKPSSGPPATGTLTLPFSLPWKSPKDYSNAIESTLLKTAGSLGRTNLPS